jgi:hypothetical protein
MVNILQMARKLNFWFFCYKTSYIIRISKPSTVLKRSFRVISVRFDKIKDGGSRIISRLPFKGFSKIEKIH